MHWVCPPVTSKISFRSREYGGNRKCTLFPFIFNNHSIPPTHSPKFGLSHLNTPLQHPIYYLRSVVSYIGYYLNVHWNQKSKTKAQCIWMWSPLMHAFLYHDFISRGNNQYSDTSVTTPLETILTSESHGSRLWNWQSPHLMMERPQSRSYIEETPARWTQQTECRYSTKVHCSPER